MRRLLLPVALVAVAAALTAAGFAGAASPARSATSAAKTLIVTWKPHDYGPVDFIAASGYKGDGFNRIRPGDVILSTNLMRNASGTVIGKVYEELTFLTPSTNMSSVDLVHAVYVFGDGEITSSVVNGPHISAEEAITGGSGAYAGARGTITDLSQSASGSKVAIRLLP